MAVNAPRPARAPTCEAVGVAAVAPSWQTGSMSQPTTALPRRRDRRARSSHAGRALLLAALAGGCARAEPAPAGATARGAPSPGVERASGAPTRRATGDEVEARPRATEAGAGARPGEAGLPLGLEVTRLAGLTLDGAPQEGVVVRVELARLAVEPRAVPGRDLAALADDPSLLLAVNAGYFEADGAPEGLLAGATVTYGVAGRRGGSGIVVVRDRRAALVPFTASFGLGDPAELAVQAGPRLVEPDGRPGIRSDDGQRAPRTVMCLGDGGRRVDLIVVWERGNPLAGPGLFALSRALTAPLLAADPRRCDQALNLDGGPSTGLVLNRQLAARVALQHLPLGPVPWALQVRARAATPPLP